MNTPQNISNSVKKGVSISATLDATNNRGSSNVATHPRTKVLKAKPSLLALYESTSIHDFNGASIRLKINNTALIKTHESQISKFTRLKQLTEEAKQKDPQSDTLTITTNGGQELVDDFLKMFGLLGASLIDQPKHEPNVLVSAARIAAPNAYQYDALYQYCLEKLKGSLLDPMERIRVARALNLTDWESGALVELFRRNEMITKDEANTLGMNAYWQVATEREGQKRRELEAIIQELIAIIQGKVQGKAKSMPQRVFWSILGVLGKIFKIFSLGLLALIIFGFCGAFD